MRSSTPLACALLLLSLAPPADAAPPASRVLRIATLVPRGTGWMKELNRFAANVARRTKRQVRVRIYGGAMMGDERDVLRKMRRDRLDGTALSGCGLGSILPAVRLLELPYLFRDVREMQAVRAGLEGGFREQLRERGFVLLGWNDVGWVRFFSRRPIKRVRDLRSLTAWAWVDDPLALALVKKLSAHAVPLAIPAVLPALQSGLVDTVYGSSYTTLALQWHTELRYFSQTRFIYGVGAFVLTRKAFDRLDAQQQKILLQEAARVQRAHRLRTRADNNAAMRQLRGAGLRVVRSDAALEQHLRRRSEELWHDLVGKLYSKAQLERALELRRAARGDPGG